MDCIAAQLYFIPRVIRVNNLCSPSAALCTRFLPISFSISLGPDSSFVRSVELGHGISLSLSNVTVRSHVMRSSASKVHTILMWELVRQGYMLVDVVHSRHG
jgi:hypothetical protein